MQELGVNQTALAKRMKVSRAYVCKVLRGEEVNFSFATALRFAHALQMDFAPQLFIISEDAIEESEPSAIHFQPSHSFALA